jgi:hypothetical protein
MKRNMGMIDRVLRAILAGSWLACISVANDRGRSHNTRDFCSDIPGDLVHRCLSALRMARYIDLEARQAR